MVHCANSWGVRVNGTLTWFKDVKAAHTAEREQLLRQAKKEPVKNPGYKIVIKGM